MTLKEALAKYMNHQVKIGSGNGFFFCDTITENTKDIIKAISNKYYAVIEKEQKRLENIDKIKAKKNNAIAKQKDKIKNWKHFLDRKVLNIYDDIELDNNLIIIIEGNEAGKYWFFEEYQTDTYDTTPFQENHFQ